MYLSGVLPWKSAQWTAPPPEEIDRIRAEAGTHDAALAEQGEIQAEANKGMQDPEKDSRESGDTGVDHQEEH